VKLHLKSLIIIAVAVVLVLVAVVMLRGKPTTAPRDTGSKNAVLSVIVSQPQTRRWPIQLTASGGIVAWQEAIIGAQTGGLRINALFADVGDWVKRGQILAELDRAKVEADLRRYEASLASAKASLSQAKSDAERTRLVKGTGVMSEQQINQYLAAEETARANVDMAEAQLAAEKVTLAQTSILAVDDGIVTARSALLGQVVSTGTELFHLQRQGRLEWQAEVDANQLALIKTGAKAELKLPSGQVLTGSVRLAAPTLSTSTSRANVFIGLPNGGPAKAGMFANGGIEAGTKSVLTVPETSVVLRDGRSFVFEVGPGDKVIRREVSVGAHRDGLVEIASGLTAQARVVNSGGAFLNDGSLVTVVKEQP
jgi:RND family efflux transporter MFP subunit